MEAIDIEEIDAAIQRVRMIGHEPDTVIMSEKAWDKFFAGPKRQLGNAHQRRVIRRRNIRRARFQQKLRSHFYER